MAEWLRTGLQIRLRRFDSGSGLHRPWNAALAQLVEHIIRNDGVTCSSHVSGTTTFLYVPKMVFAGRPCLSGGGVTLRLGRLVAALGAAWRLERVAGIEPA